MNMPHEAQLRIERSERFDLPLPVRFRARGESAWHDGVVKNISGSGALIVGSDEVPIGAELEVWLLMREYRSDVANVVCPSVVVRCDQQPDEETAFTSAMKFRKFEFRPDS
jgi:hypothetical protein